MFVKLLTILFLSFEALPGSQQILLVVAEDFNTSTAHLQRFEQTGTGHFQPVGTSIAVNLGRNGLGWEAENSFRHSGTLPVKREGDGRSPAGIFRLRSVFGYADQAMTEMSYIKATEHLICIDDVASPFYNRIVPIAPDLSVKSFEWMKRDDPLYELGVIVDHNVRNIRGGGSCIFLHVEKAPGAPTSGCTSMPLRAMKQLVAWLDPHADPVLIQIPKPYCSELRRYFRGLSCP